MTLTSQNDGQSWSEQIASDCRTEEKARSRPIADVLMDAADYLDDHCGIPDPHRWLLGWVIEEASLLPHQREFLEAALRNAKS